PTNLILAAVSRWPSGATPAALRAAAAAMAADRLVEHTESDGLTAVPVHVSGSVTGSLVAVHGETTEAEVLGAFAQQISLALNDARTVEAMREAYRDPLTGLPNRALFLERLE